MDLFKLVYKQTSKITPKLQQIIGPERFIRCFCNLKLHFWMIKYNHFLAQLKIKSELVKFWQFLLVNIFFQNSRIV